VIDQPNTPAHVHRIDVGELVLNVTEYGTGPTIFLLHGIGSREMTWWPVIDRLAPHLHLVIPDWRGHGASDKPSRGYGLEDYARDLDGLITAYGAARPKLVGHSLGGAVALAWARHQPARADRIVIEDSPLRNLPNNAKLFADWIALARSTVDEAAAHYALAYPRWTAAECRRRAESITLTAIPVFEESRDRRVGNDNVDRIAESAAILSPVLLVHGDIESGGMVVQADAERFADTLPNARAVRIPGGSHSLHRDAPEQFLDAVLPFLLDGGDIR
jgi:pimeloyl-ACP methyl ester carboxylesterase